MRYVRYIYNHCQYHDNNEDEDDDDVHTFDPWHHLIVADSLSSSHRRTFACDIQYTRYDAVDFKLEPPLYESDHPILQSTIMLHNILVSKRFKMVGTVQTLGIFYL